MKLKVQILSCNVILKFTKPPNLTIYKRVYIKYKTTIPIEGDVVCISLVFRFLFTPLLGLSGTWDSTAYEKK